MEKPKKNLIFTLRPDSLYKKKKSKKTLFLVSIRKKKSRDTVRSVSWRKAQKVHCTNKFIHEDLNSVFGRRENKSIRERTLSSSIKKNQVFTLAVVSTNVKNSTRGGKSKKRTARIVFQHSYRVHRIKNYFTIAYNLKKLANTKKAAAQKSIFSKTKSIPV